MNDIYKNAAQVLNDGGVVVFPTDTIYGILGRADSPETVNRIFKIKRRPPDARLIIVAGNVEQIEGSILDIPDIYKNFLRTIWPNPVSVELPVSSKTPSHLSRGFGEIALRVPSKKSLLGLLHLTGPLVATSANISGFPHVEDIASAKKTFGEQINLYVDEGEIEGQPSTLIGFGERGELKIFREGAMNAKEIRRIFEEKCSGNGNK